MNIKTCRYFLTLAEEMNFTKAAEKLHLTQQSLSGTIKRLEDEYQVELFQRKPSLKLTPSGELVAFYAKQLLKIEAQMTAGLADLSASCAGRLNLGMPGQRSRYFFPGIWNRYHERFPNISVTLHEDTTSNLIADLQAGKLDLMVGIDVPPTSNLSIIPIASERLLCLVSERLLQKHMPQDWEAFLAESREKGVDLLAMKDLPFLMLSPEHYLRTALDQFFAGKNTMPRILLESSEQSVIYRVSCEGSGIGLFSPMILYDYSKGGLAWPEDCHLFQVRSPIHANQISIVSRNDVSLPRFVEEMKKAVIQEFASYHIAVRKFLAQM